jgi:hypothetical protein
MNYKSVEIDAYDIELYQYAWCISIGNFVYLDVS